MLNLYKFSNHNSYSIEITYQEYQEVRRNILEYFIRKRENYNEIELDQFLDYDKKELFRYLKNVETTSEKYNMVLKRVNDLYTFNLKSKLLSFYKQLEIYNNVQRPLSLAVRLIGIWCLLRMEIVETFKHFNSFPNSFANEEQDILYALLR